VLAGVPDNEGIPQYRLTVDDQDAPYRYTLDRPLVEILADAAYQAIATRADRHRTLGPGQLGDEECPTCGYPASAGTLSFEDRGPFQLISRRSLRCSNGHRWTRETDGG
jgi:hypothetical protein